MTVSSGRACIGAILGAACYDRDEVRVIRIDARQPSGGAAAERGIPRAPIGLDPEAVRQEDVSESLERDHVDMLQRLLLDGLAGVQRQRVADRPPARDVGGGERLVADEQSRDVVPAREILRADDGEAAAPQDALGLEDEVVEPRDVLDHLVRMHDVDRPGVERPVIVEVAGANIEAASAGATCLWLDDLQAVDLTRRDPQTAAQPFGPGAVLAADIEQLGRDADTTDGLPLPPARLRAQVGPAHADASYFLESGRQHAGLIRELLREDGTSIEDLDALLDWGCGCGRVLRQWADLAATRVVGCDIDPRMIEWCERNLPFVDVAVTGMSPPLPYGGDTFDLIYAFSVFTHLSQPLQHDWVAECRRVLRPGGYLLISTLGEHYASLDRLTSSELESFKSGKVVVLYERSAGTSLCSAYHPPQYVRDRLATGFDYVS